MEEGAGEEAVRLRTAYILTFLAVGSTVAIAVAFLSFWLIFFLQISGAFPRDLYDHVNTLLIGAAVVAWAGAIALGARLGRAAEARWKAEPGVWEAGERAGLLVGALVSISFTGFGVAGITHELGSLRRGAIATPNRMQEQFAADDSVVHGSYRIDTLLVSKTPDAKEWIVEAFLRGTRPGKYRFYWTMTSSDFSQPLERVERVLDLRGEPAREVVRYRVAWLESTYCRLWDPSGTRYLGGNTHVDLGAALVPIDLDSAQWQRTQWRVGSRKDVYLPFAISCPLTKTEAVSERADRR